MSNAAKLWWSSIGHEGRYTLFIEFYGLAEPHLAIPQSIQYMYEVESAKRIMT